MKPLSILLLASLLAAAACSTDSIKLQKSPCVGLDDSPCGPKRDVNGWWLQHAAPPSNQA